MEGYQDLLKACKALMELDSYWWQEANGIDDDIREAIKKIEKND